MYEPHDLEGDQTKKLSPLISSDMAQWFDINKFQTLDMIKFYVPKALSNPIGLHATSSSFRTFRHHVYHNQAAKKVLLGAGFKLQFDKSQGKSVYEKNSFLSHVSVTQKNFPLSGYPSI
jgi:hypothetical protein